MTAINLEDELSLSESKWRGRIVTLAMLGVAGGLIAAGLYYFVFRSDSTALTRSTEEIPVARATINQTLTISGVADAQLSSNLAFQSSGKISDVNVKVGDSVLQGDVLASVQSDDLQNGVDQAFAAQHAAQLKLDDLLSGSTTAELAAADQGLATAQANLTKAQNDYNTLVNGGSPADVSAAEQGVKAAEAQLASAKAARAKLDDTPSSADKAAAEAAVAAAQSALTAAQTAASNAQNAVTTADASLKSAEHSYCAIPPVTLPAFCITPAAPISSADATLVNDALSTANATLANGVIAANSAYLSASNSLNSANAAVTSAQQALTSAQAKLSSVNDGPTAADIASADAAVTSAQASVDAANDKLNTLKSGGTAEQQSTLAAAVTSAQASVNAAQAKRDEAYRGPTANAIAQARQAVQTASLNVVAANIKLKNAQIIAPFDGVVAAVNAKVGEFASGGLGGSSAASATGSSSSSSAPIVLLTPNRVRLKMSVQETDYANIKLDQGGVVLFDALPGKPYPFKVTSIGQSPTTTNGVVTYEVDGELVVLPNNPAPATGMNGRGQIVTDSRPNVLVVPPRALKKRGNDQIVSVKRANDNVEEVVVTTGATDGNNVEVLTGLAEGDTVEVVTLSAAKGAGTPKPQSTIPSGLR